MANKSRRGRGSFESQMDALVEQYMTNTSNWNKRNDALLAMQELFESVEGEANPQIFTADFFKKIKIPLMESLSDLRSQLVREGCNTIVVLAKVGGDLTRPLFRELLPHMIDIVGSGNKVIMANVDQSIVAIIQHMRNRQVIPYIVDQLKQSKSKELREACAEYICHILQNWTASYLEKDTEILREAIESAVRDASQTCRAIARRCFAIYRDYWPAEADLILRKVDLRTQKLLTDAIEELSRSQTRDFKSQQPDDIYASQDLLTEELNRGNDEDFNLHAPENGNGPSRGNNSRASQSGGPSSRRDQGWRLQRGEQGLTETTSYNRSRNDSSIPFSRSSNQNKSGSRKNRSSRRDNDQDDTNGGYLSTASNFTTNTNNNYRSRGSSFQNDAHNLQSIQSIGTDISGPPPEAFVSPERDTDYNKKDSILQQELELDYKKERARERERETARQAELLARKKAELERDRLEIERQRQEMERERKERELERQKQEMDKKDREKRDVKQQQQTPVQAPKEPSKSPPTMKEYVNKPTVSSTVDSSIQQDLAQDSMNVEFNVGDVVSLGKKVVGKEVTGIVRFAGETQFAAGIWVGLELEGEDGKNDGSVKGVRYFTCRPNHGIFVRQNQLKNLSTKIERAAPPQSVVVDPLIQQMSVDLLKHHKIHIDEVMATMKEEYEILSEFEKLTQNPAKDQLTTYMEAIECCLDQREESCRKLRNQLQTLRLQSFRGRLSSVDR